MQPVNYHIRLDAGKPGSQAGIAVRRGDTKSRQITIFLYNESAPLELSSDMNVILTAKKADGTIVYTDCEVSGNAVTKLIPAQMTAAAGTVRCELSIYDGGNQLLYSPEFDVFVEDRKSVV